MATVRQHEPKDPIQELALLLWVRIPRAVLARFAGARGVAGDGYQLAAVPPLAVLAPLLVAAGAFAVGAGRLGYADVYTESIPLMAAAVGLGVFSTQLGVIAVAGFAVGEFFAAELSWSLPRSFRGGGPLSSGLLGNLARVRLPLIITYLLLAVAVVIVPRTARALVSQLGRWRRTPLALAWPIGSAIFIVVLSIALPMWAAFAPTLVRPRFTWLGTVPTAEAVQPLQRRGGTIVATAVVVGMARQILIGLSLWWAPFRRRVGAAEDDAVRLFDGRPGVPRQSPTRRRLVGDVVSATLATLVLAGVLERAWLWALAFGVLFTVRLLRSGVIATSLVDRWKAVTSRVPSVARVVVLFLVTRTMTDALGETVITSYTRVALVVIAGAILVFVVFPGRADQVPAAPPDASP